MAAMNELKAVHMPSETHREFRSLVKYRKTLDCRINKVKCTIRAWFVNHGISIDTGETDRNGRITLLRRLPYTEHRTNSNKDKTTSGL